MNDTCICDNVPKVWRLTGVTRTLRLRIFNPDGTPLDLTGRTVAVTIARDNSEFSYAPGFVIEGDDNNVVKFEWPADQQGAGDYTINVTTTDGSGNADRVNWHGPTGIRLVDFSFMVRGEDALGVTSEANIGLDGTFTMNGAGMSAYDEWLVEGHTGTPEDFIVWLRQPAEDAATEAEATVDAKMAEVDADMAAIEATAAADHTRAETDHTTATGDHTRAEADHVQAVTDSQQAATDHQQAESDAAAAAIDREKAAADRTKAADDRQQAAADHATAAQDHATASSDHQQAQSDHSTASADHTQATQDAERAASDHTRAGDDHDTAVADHQQAEADHTRAEADHTTAAADHTQATADHAVMEGYDTRLGNVEGEVSQLGQEVTDLDLQISGGNLEIFDTLVFEQGAISTANGGNQSSMTQVRSDFVVTPSLRVTVTNGSVYVYGWNGDIYLSAIGWKTGTNDFEITGATKYKLVFKLPSGNLTPAGVGDLGASVYVPIRGEVVKCVSQTLNDMEKQTARDNIGAASEEYVGGNSLAEEIDLSAYQDEMYYITPGGSWALNTGQGRSKNVTIVPGEKYRITNNKSNESYYAFLHSLTGQTTTGVVDYAAGYSGRTPLASGQSADIIAPDNAKYLYILKSYASGTDVLPNVYEIKKTITQRVEDLENMEQGGADLARIFESIPIPIDADGYELPMTFGMNAALKKAAQGNQIKYVAKKAYPTLDSPTGAAAGEKTGFPYSSVKEMAKFIHWHVSERTFMTAINNEYGLFYTEDVAGNNSRSDYGYTYHGVNCGPYYGMVCNIFALWCLGYPVPFDTTQFAYLARKGVLVRLNNQTAQTVHICDLVWFQGHTALVTSVKHDEYGNVTEVKITESMGHVKTTTFTAAQFDTYLHITHDAILYRPTFVYKNTYQPSEFIGVRGEATPSAYEYNDDICFFAGDYAAWKLGENAWVNYTKGSFTGMKIYKDDTIVATITLDNDSSVHKVNVTSYINGAGKYKACLTDGVNDSDCTYWQMVGATASYSNGVVSFGSANGTPWYIQVCSSNGSAYCWYEITHEDIINGEVALDLADMVAEQYGDVSVTQYVRVAFRAEYGGVVSDFIQI